MNSLCLSVSLEISEIYVLFFLFTKNVFPFSIFAKVVEIIFVVVYVYEVV